MVVPHLRQGGVVNVVYNLCKELVLRGEIHVHVLSLRKETSNTMAANFVALGIKVELLNNSYLDCEIFTEKVVRQVQCYVDQNDIHLVHSHEYHAALVCSRLSNVVRVSTLHNRATEDYTNVFGKYFGGYMLKRYFQALDKYQFNVAVSQSAEELYRFYIPNVTHVNNGVDVDFFRPVENNRVMELKRFLNLPPKGKIIVSAGRIEKEKRVEQLVSWFHDQDHSDFYLLILGEGKKLSRCKSIAVNDNHIIFTGKVANVADYFSCSDYYISYSRSEGMSLAVCEGVSSGLFPILSDIPSHHDVGDEINALFFSEPSQIILNSLESVRCEKKFYHNYIRDNFSIYTMTNGYLKIYEKCTNWYYDKR